MHSESKEEEEERKRKRKEKRKATVSTGRHELPSSSCHFLLSSLN